MRLSLILTLIFLFSCEKPQHSLVLQSDFGEKDGAVAAMRGVAMSVSSTMKIYDLTHEIPAYNIWEASYRLGQTVSYWPEGTVFVSVVDPGVGTERKSVVMKTKSGHYIVTPDNGTLTHVAEQLGVESVREIDEAVNRRQDSEQSYTFHGRDVYAYTGARLASGKISFEQVGQDLGTSVDMITHQKAEIKGDVLHGGIPILDVQYGNIWTNIPRDLFKKMGFKKGDILNISILQDNESKLEMSIPFVNTFGDVDEGQPLAYLNSLNNLSFALNMANFSDQHQIGSGQDWRVKIIRE